jgi:glycosyltransferase involved in cell wall biosynthesis
MNVSNSSTQKASLPLVSLVIPCYNEEEVIGEVIARLKIFANEAKSVSVEFIFVDDGSQDRTRELLKEFATTDLRIKLIGFARNFGHQVAVSAGIDAAAGDAVVLIDADLQDPPEVVNEMIVLWQAGYDVVYGTRASRAGESVFKVATARAFYRLLNTMSEVPIPLDTGDFRLMSRVVVDALRQMPERERFVRGMVSWIGFKQIALPYNREERFAGKSKYPLTKMLRFALDGIMSFSRKPLQFSVALGVFAALLALIGAFYAIYIRIFENNWIAGLPGVLIAVFFLGGVQLISIGIVGEYVGRIYTEIKGRPLYIIQETIGIDDDPKRYIRSPNPRP